MVAQEKFQNIQKKLDSTTLSYTKNGKTSSVLNAILTNFNQSKKFDIADLKKTNVGICIVLYENNPDLIVSPAKYSFDNDKINISAIGPQNPNELSGNMKDYVQKYLTQMESLGSNTLFSKLILKKFETEGTFFENNSEYVVNEPNTLSFIRGNEDWMFIISIEDTYYNLSDPRIIVYAFKKSISGKDIFNMNNSLENMEQRRVEKLSQQNKDRADYPLYHDYRIEDLRVGLKQLLKFEPYKSNKELQNYFKNIPENLDRFTIRNYTKELHYFADLKISEDFIKEHFDSAPHGEYEVENITHLSNHALGDIYFSQGNYQLAKEYYTKSIFTYPLIVLSGTTYGKDIDRIIYDLAKNAYKANKKNEAYAFLIALMFDSNFNTEKEINDYFKEQNEDKKQFKKDLDKALKTIKKGEKYSYTFTFRGNEAFFIPMIQETPKSFQEYLVNSNFYKSLQ